jgi:hypothetical protein
MWCVVHKIATSSNREIGTRTVCSCHDNQRTLVTMTSVHGLPHIRGVQIALAYSIWNPALQAFIEYLGGSEGRLSLPEDAWLKWRKSRLDFGYRYIYIYYYLLIETSSTLLYWRKILESGLFFLIQCHHMSVMDFVVSPPGCGRSVTDFWGWDVHEARLRCPDEVVGDIWIWSTRRGLKPKLY